MFERKKRISLLPTNTPPLPIRFYYISVDFQGESEITVNGKPSRGRLSDIYTREFIKVLMWIKLGGNGVLRMFGLIRLVERPTLNIAPKLHQGKPRLNVLPPLPRLAAGYSQLTEHPLLAPTDHYRRS